MHRRFALLLALIRDGSLLDDDTLRELVAWAKEKDFQLWIERVAPGGENGGLVIEEGRLKSAPVPAPEPVKAKPRKPASVPAPKPAPKQDDDGGW